LRQPVLSLVVRVQPHGDEAAPLERLDRELDGILPGGDGAPGFPAEGPARLTARLLYWAGEMQRHVGLGVFEAGKTLPVGEREQNRFQVLVPVMPRTHANAAQAVQWLLRLFNHAWEGRSTARLREDLPGIWRTLGKSVPGSQNAMPFMRSAHRLGIPLSHVAGGVYQFGYGARSRWLNSTFTDRTPQISAVLARNKNLAAKTLARAGLPVPAHVAVGDWKGALAAAGKLGYPVVVKPGDRDRGEGVMAGLRDAASLQKAFDKAREVSKNILIERHVEGRDYRLTVLEGEFVWAVERVPGGVTGDGEHTVRELIERLNSDPERGRAIHFLRCFPNSRCPRRTCPQPAGSCVCAGWATSAAAVRRWR
jgi:cyanophycin synthetase